MARLIDADALIEAMEKLEEDYENMGSIPNWFTALRIIKEQPTAYDVEKVVKEMERIKNDASQGCDEVSHDKCNTYKNCADCIFDRTISIVKRGGVE